MSRKTPVVWDTSERAAFLEAAKSLGYPKRGDSENVWRKAQEIAGFSPERIRKFEPATAALMNSERKQANKQVNNKSAQKPSVAIITHPVPTAPGVLTVVPPPKLEQAEPAPAPAPVPTPEPTPIETVWAEQIAGKVANVLSDSILQLLYNPQIRLALRDIVKEMITPETELQQEQAVTWREPKTPKERLPRIVIGGGPPGLRDLFKGFRTADLRFWGQGRGESIHRLNAVAANADLIYMMHGTPHKVTFALDARKYKYTMWRHSFSELKLELERIIPTLLAPNGEEQ